MIPTSVPDLDSTPEAAGRCDCSHGRQRPPALGLGEVYVTSDGQVWEVRDGSLLRLDLGTAGNA